MSNKWPLRETANSSFLRLSGRPLKAEVALGRPLDQDPHPDPDPDPDPDPGSRSGSGPWIRIPDGGSWRHLTGPGDLLAALGLALEGFHGIPWISMDFHGLGGKVPSKLVVIGLFWALLS